MTQSPHDPPASTAKPHPFLLRNGGTRLMLQSPLGEECRVCGRGKLWTVADTHGSEDVPLHCDVCDYQETRRRAAVPLAHLHPAQRRAEPSRSALPGYAAPADPFGPGGGS